MRLILPASYAEDIWVHLQKYLFHKYDDGLSYIYYQDVIDHNVDALFQTHLNVSIFDVVEFYIEERDLRIYDLVRSGMRHKEPGEINYKTELIGALHWDYTFVYGRLLKAVGIELDENFEPISGREIVQVLFDYDIDDQMSGYVKSRKKIIKWYKNSGMLCKTTKTMLKSYSSGGKGPAEAERRRKNIIDKLVKDIQDLLIAGGASQGGALSATQAFVATIKADVDSYIVWAFTDILTTIAAHPDPMLLVDMGGGYTVRQYILDSLDYWSYESGGGEYKGTLL